MKNKIIATLVAFGLVGSASAIEINDNLSINGFIDGSVNKVDGQTAGTDSSNWGLDEIEVNFLLNVGSVSGLIALDSQNIGSGNDDIEIEQAHFTYSLDNGVSFTFGRYGSAAGLEREDPAGLYTYSRAYGAGNVFNLGDIDNNAKEGLTISYAAEAWTLAVSIENPAGTIRTAGVGSSKDDLDYEVALNYTGIENLNFNVGYFKDNRASAADETDAVNVNATYQVGKALLGAEYTELSTDALDRDAMLLLVDYDVSDKLGVAVRYSTYEETANVDVDKITIAPNYAITESLGAILEYSDISHDTAGQDSDEIALELTYTF
jgi:hypothetical protein